MNVTFVLILFYFGDGHAITSIPEFSTKQECESAGELAKSVANAAFSGVRYTCVQQSRPTNPG
jgi:hypothetical protein